MAVIGTSSRGERVDFEILAIKQQLASKPVAVGVNERRSFIDTKDGVKAKPVIQQIRNALVTMPAISDNSDLNDMLTAVEAPVKSKK